MNAEAFADSVANMPVITQTVILMTLAGRLGVSLIYGELNCEMDFTYRWEPADRADAYEVYEAWPGEPWKLAAVVFSPSVMLTIKPPGREGVRVRGLSLKDTLQYGPFSEPSDPEPTITKKEQ